MFNIFGAYIFVSVLKVSFIINELKHIRRDKSNIIIASLPKQDNKSTI
jgi:hypothetical protein